MPKRISWKKGMRLTQEVLRASDQSSIELTNIALALCASSRFGLMPSSTPFNLSVDISKGYLDVGTLNCMGITRDGSLIEAHYDTRYNNAFDTRIQIPTDLGVNELLLTINIDPEKWVETNDGFEEPAYYFNLLPPDTVVPANALPIGRILDSDFGGWHLDDAEFVPPCLFVTAHPKFMDILSRFKQVLSSINQKAQGLLNSDGKNAMRIFWPVVQRLLITVDKEGEVMTPAALLGNVQKFVSAFTCACDLDDYLELTEAESFRSFILRPYSYKNAVATIEEGLSLCYQINEKIDKLQVAPKAQPSRPGLLEAPTIDSSQLEKRCTNSTARIAITNNAPGATVYYTIDGSEPTESSKSGLAVVLESGFANVRRKEPDKTFTIKVKAFNNGASSRTNTFEVKLIKDIARWTGIEI